MKEVGDLALKEALTNLRSGKKTTPVAQDKPKARGKARGKTEPLPATSAQVTQPIIYNTIEEGIEVSSIEIIDYKSEMTEREQKFIMLHILNHIPAKTGLILSDYREYNEKHAYAIARKTITLL